MTVRLAAYSTLQPGPMSTKPVLDTLDTMSMSRSFLYIVLGLVLLNETPLPPKGLFSQYRSCLVWGFVTVVLTAQVHIHHSKKLRVALKSCTLRNFALQVLFVYFSING